MLADGRCIVPAAPCICSVSRRCALPNSAPGLSQMPRPLLSADARSIHAKPQRLARRDATATMQATADSYTADVPVAGEEVQLSIACKNLFSVILSDEECSDKTRARAQAKWYALVANAEFMLHDVQNEAFAEQLRERVRLFGEKNRKLDFFLVSEPKWLEENFPKESKQVGRPCVALVSTDKIWIT